jgi:hypothetical protein
MVKVPQDQSPEEWREAGRGRAPQELSGMDLAGRDRTLQEEDGKIEAGRQE